MEAVDKAKVSNQNSPVSSRHTNWTVKRHYRDEKVPHLRTEIIINTPIKGDELDAFRQMLTMQRLSEVLEKVNAEVEELFGDALEADIERITTSAKNLLKEPLE